MKKALSIILSIVMLANLSFFTAVTVTAEDADTEITSLTTLPEKQWGWIEGTAIAAPEATATATNIAGVSLTPVWSGADGFEFGETADGEEVVAYTASYTAPDGYVFASSLASATENTTLSDDGKTLTYKFYTYVIPKNAIYIDDGGSDSTDDYAEGNVQKPYKTIAHAMELLESKGGGTIVIVDKVIETSSGAIGTLRNGHYTLVGWDEESTLETTGHYNLCADMTWRDLNIITSLKWGGIYARGYSFTLGDPRYTDLTVTESVDASSQLFMTSDGGTFTNPGKFTINSGSWSTLVASGYGQTTITGDVEYEINGGTLSSLYMGLHCGNSAKDHTLNGNIKCTINGGTIGTLSMTSCNQRYIHNGDANLIINGGTINNVTFTTNSRTFNAGTENEYTVVPEQNGDYTLTINGGTITGTISNTPVENITGQTTVDVLDYEGDKDALLAKIKTEQFDEIKSKVVYVDAVNGVSGNDGLAPDAAVPTLTEAFAMFANGVSGKIVLIGEVPTHVYNETTTKWDSKAVDKSGRGSVIITGYDDNSNFVFCKSTTLAGDTTFENIGIVNSGQYANLFAGGHTLVMGEGIRSSTTTTHELQIGNGGSSAVVEKGDIIIHSGTYGLIYSGADFNGGAVTGDTNLTIYGGTFTSDVYAGGYVSSAAKSVSDSTSGKIGGKIGLYIHGGTFNKAIYVGGNQYGTVGSAEVKITDGTFKGAINIGPNKASGTYTPESGTATDYKTDILGNVIVEITGGTINGAIKHTGNTIGGKTVVIASNGTAVTFGNPEKLTYAVSASSKGTTTYDADSDKFSLVPMNDTMDIYVNDNAVAKSADNLYTLSGGTNNLYTIRYGGETAAQAKFIITHPIAELTPVSDVILTGGKKTYNPIGNCTASKITWEPADAKFKFDTEYTATLTLTAIEGIEFSDDFAGVIINNGNEDHVVGLTLSEDKTQITVTVKFPRTAKSDFDILAEKTTPVEIKFTTSRVGENDSFFHPTAITLENCATGAKQTVTATENGNSGTYTADLASGLYNITVKKQGYLEAKLESVMIDSDETQTVDFGKLIAGDVIGKNGDVSGDGEINVDDFILTLRGFASDAIAAVKDAANIVENTTVTVADLGAIKTNYEKKAADLSKYSGLFENTYYKLTVDKKLTIGYIGGSIIQGAGVESAGSEKYIDRMHKWFNEKFPEAEIHSINAGISNTGSNFASFRLEKDLMLRDEGYIPDLVFLEFCVNDFNTFGQDHIEMLYESLINNVYEINPNADIVCVLTALHGYDIPKNAHIKVANHYGIPVLDVGTPMSYNYGIVDDCKIFTDDELHPNGMGYELYAKLTKNLLEKYIVYGTPENPKYTEKVLPERLSEQLLTNAKAIPVTDESVTTTGTWTTGTINTGSRIFQADKQAPYVLSSTAGDTLTFTFNGDAFGFMVRKSAAMGTFEYSVDGGEWRECNFGTSQLYTHCQIFIPGCVSADEVLTAGKHTVTVRVTGKPTHSTSTGCEVGIAGILYNAAE